MYPNQFGAVIKADYVVVELPFEDLRHMVKQMFTAAGAKDDELELMLEPLGTHLMYSVSAKGETEKILKEQPVNLLELSIDETLDAVFEVEDTENEIEDGMVQVRIPFESYMKKVFAL